jgi:hypothetical protein
MFGLVTVIGALALTVVVVRDRTTLAFSLGTTTSTIAVILEPRSTACQAPIDVPSYGRFDRLVVQVGTYGASGPSLAVVVRDGSGRNVARGRLPGGYPDVGQAPRHVVVLDGSPRGRGLAVCLTNHGSTRVAIYGSGDNASKSSTATLDGKRVGRDMNIEFRRPGRTFASIFGSILDRAVLWRAPRLTGPVYGALLVALVVGAGTALMIATRRLEAD